MQIGEMKGEPFINTRTSQWRKRIRSAWAYTSPVITIAGLGLGVYGLLAAQKSNRELDIAKTSLEAFQVERADRIRANEENSRLLFDLKDSLNSAQLAADRRDSVVQFVQEALSLLPYTESHNDWITKAGQMAELRLTNDPTTRGMIRSLLGSICYEIGEYSSAEAHSIAAVELFRQEDDSLSPEMIDARDVAIASRAAMGQVQQSIDEYRQILRDLQDPTDAQNEELLGIKQNLASLLVMSPDYARDDAELELIIEGVVRQSTSWYGPEDTRTLYAENLRLTYRAMRGDDGLEKQATDLRNRISSAMGSRHPLYGRVSSHIVFARYQRGDLAGAAEILQHALSIESDVLGSSHPYTLQTRRNLLVVLEEMDRAHEAAAEADLLVSALMRIHGESHRETGQALLTRSLLRARDPGRSFDAVHDAKWGLKIIEEAAQSESEILNAKMILAEVLRLAGDTSEALAVCSSVFEASQDASEIDNTLLVQAHSNLGVLLMGNQEYERAVHLLEYAAQNADEAMPPHHWRPAQIKMHYARGLAGIGRCDDSVRLAENAVESLRSRLGEDHHRVRTAYKDLKAIQIICASD